MAERSHRSHTGPAHRLPGGPSCRQCTHRTPAAPGTGTPRPGEHLAAGPASRRLAGPAWRPVHHGRDHGGGTWRLDTRRPPQTTHGLSRPDPRSILPWGAAPSGFPHPSRSSPGPSALVAGAWASRDPANVRRHLPRRLAPPPNAIQDIRGKTHVRLCHRDRQRMARGQHAHQAVVAMASELVACMGAMATEVPVLLEKVPGVLARSDSTAIPGEETPPRCGATLDRVKRRNALAPRLRQAPDGGPSGGTQSTAISRINRRV
jgi:hypothetical protein